MNDRWYRNTLDELQFPQTLSLEILYCIISDALISFLDKQLQLEHLLHVLHTMQQIELTQQQPELAVIVSDFIALSQGEDAAESNRTEIIGLLERVIYQMNPINPINEES